MLLLVVTQFVMIRTESQPDAMIRWLSTLADTTRVRLLRLLERQELGVSDLCAVVRMPQSTVSRHLKVLADESWLISRRQATTNLYRMVLDELDPGQRDLWVLTRDRTAAWPTLAQDEMRLVARLAERDGDSRSFFEGVARDWDRVRSESYGDRFGNEALLALLPSDWRVVDFGCGTGHLAMQLAPDVQTVVGLDHSPAMLEAALQQTQDLSSLQLIETDLAQVPLKTESFDAALCVLVVTYLDDPVPVLREMSRVLRPGGKAIIVDLMLHDRDEFRRSMGQKSMGFTCTSLTGLLEASGGFNQATCRPLPPVPEAEGPALLLAVATK